ncbi:MAG: TraU family protein [Methylovulum sp.]|nr:TraU family protein [Methylovulum sp.]
MRAIFSPLIIAMCFSFTATVSAEISTQNIDAGKLLCPDADFWGKKMITNVCWSCLFPVRLAGFTFFDDDNDLPDEATDEIFCSCSGDEGLPVFGMTAGAWLPARLIEVVRKPYCSPILGGTSFNEGVRLWGGRKEVEGDGTDKTYYNYHYWAFPLYVILDLFVQNNCNAGGLRNLDMMYMSELDPTWNIDELAFFINPEAVVFANPLAVAACTVDCTVTTVSQPMTSLWWCAGCWGNLYPFTGNIASDGSSPRDTSLLSARVLASLHRKGLAHKTYGDDALCSGQIYPMIPKQQYKLSTLFPLAEASEDAVESTDSNGNIISKITDNCCHYIGESTFNWGEWRTIPGAGEDYVYLLWRYTECCLTGDNDH